MGEGLTGSGWSAGPPEPQPDLVGLPGHSYNSTVTVPKRRLGILDRPIWIYSIIAGAAFAFGWPLCRRAIILSDEGYLLQQALDLLNGRVLYSDMDAFITPGIWFTLAGAFALLGPSVLVSRAVIVVAYVALAITGYRIVAPEAGRSWGIGAVAALLLFSVWAFPAWTFAFYSPVAILFALAAVERLLAWQREARTRDLVWVGVLVGLSVCFKQNYGVFAALGIGVAYMAMKLEARKPVGEALVGAGRELGLIALAAIAVGLPFLAYLVAHGAMGDAWTSLVVHPFEFGGRHDIAYASFSQLWNPDLFSTGVEKLTYLSYSILNSPPVPVLGSGQFVQRLHVLLYWLAPLILGIGFVLSWISGRAAGKRIDAALFGVSAAAGLIYLGVFPRADFNHLINVYQPILIAAPLIAQRLFVLLGSQKRVIRWSFRGVAGAVALTYGLVALFWYGSLLKKLNTPLEQPRGGVLVTPLEAMEINYQVRHIHKNIPESGALFTLPDLTMLNFLAERSVPSAWYNLYEHHIAQDSGRGVADAVEAQGVQYAVARYNNFFSDRVGLLDYAPELSSYLISNFERIFVGGRENYIVYRRREQPSTEHPHLDPLADCEFETHGGEVKKHLLFSALYHKAAFGRPIPEDGITTRCPLQIPQSGGFLALEIGYRKPHRSSPGTRLKASIDVLAQGERTSILSERLPVVRWRDAPRQQAFKRFEIDLGPWAGQAITLEFATQLEGSTLDSQLDLKGFAMVYRDPRLQSKPGGARP